MNRHVWARRVITLALIVELALLILFRRANLDEGWYLWASKLVYEGKWLYHDFAYTQGPVLPYVYGLAQMLGRGLYEGRLLTTFFALLAFLLAGRIAKKRSGEAAETLCLLIILTSLYPLSAYAYTATYALAAFLIILAVFIAGEDDHHDARLILATFSICLAIGVRLSVVGAAAPFLIYLILTSPRRGRALVFVGLTALLALGLVFIPFLMTDRALVLYDLFGFHTDRMPRDWQLITSTDSIEYFIADFGGLLALLVAGLVAWLWQIMRQPQRRAFLRAYALALTLAGMILGPFILHLIPRTTTSYYNSLQLPLFGILGGVMLARVWSALRPQKAMASILIVLVLLANTITNVLAIRRYDLVPIPPRNQIAAIRGAAHYLRSLLPPGSRLLTFDTHLALEAGLDIPPGYEMSIFSYRPTFTAEQASRWRVIDNEKLLADLQQPAPAVAMTTFDLDLLYGDRDRLLNTLQHTYRWVKTIPGIGPFDNDLRIFLPPQFAMPAPSATLRASPAVTMTTSLADGITFLGYDLGPARPQPGDKLDLTLYWRAATTPGRSYTVFTHVLDGNGAVVAGWDNQPCHATCPTDAWQPGEILRDEYAIPLPATLAPGTYTLEIGLYEPGTGARVPVFTTDAQSASDRIVLGQVLVERG